MTSILHYLGMVAIGAMIGVALIVSVSIAIVLEARAPARGPGAQLKIEVAAPPKLRVAADCNAPAQNCT